MEERVTTSGNNQISAKPCDLPARRTPDVAGNLNDKISYNHANERQGTAEWGPTVDSV